MGHNLDLIYLLGLPEKTKCLRCKEEIQTRFDDYDIDCGDPEVSKNNGKLVLHVFCNNCEHEFSMQFTIKEVIE